ncbi:MAG: hypothetical protein PVH68_19510 [Armatimonadota bacterium]|jgi:hypothetical protein
MLTVKVVAGARAGKSYCLTCDAAGKPLAVTFVNSANDMAADYAREFDKLAARHKKSKLSTAIVFLGDPAADEARLREIAATRKLRRVSLAVLTKPEELEDWQLDTTHPTNAYIVRNNRIAKHFAAECPFCDKLRGRISRSLWTMFAAGRGTWGTVTYGIKEAPPGGP